MEIKKRKKEEKGFESKKEEKKVIEKEKIGKKRKDKIIERIVEIWRMKNGEKILIVEMCKKVKMIVRIKKKK